MIRSDNAVWKAIRPAHGKSISGNAHAATNSTGPAQRLVFNHQLMNDGAWAGAGSNGRFVIPSSNRIMLSGSGRKSPASSLNCRR